MLKQTLPIVFRQDLIARAANADVLGMAAAAGISSSTGGTRPARPPSDSGASATETKGGTFTSSALGSNDAARRKTLHALVRPYSTGRDSEDRERALARTLHREIKTELHKQLTCPLDPEKFETLNVKYREALNELSSNEKLPPLVRHHAEETRMGLLGLRSLSALLKPGLVMSSETAKLPFSELLVPATLNEYHSMLEDCIDNSHRLKNVLNHPDLQKRLPYDQALAVRLYTDPDNRIFLTNAVERTPVMEIARPMTAIVHDKLDAALAILEKNPDFAVHADEIYRGMTFSPDMMQKMHLYHASLQAKNIPTEPTLSVTSFTPDLRSSYALRKAAEYPVGVEVRGPHGAIDASDLCDTNYARESECLQRRGATHKVVSTAIIDKANGPSWSLVLKAVGHKPD